jgi:hypothetical protein
MNNNQMFPRIGIVTLGSIVRSPQPHVDDEGPEKSGSEYEPQTNEGCEDDDEEEEVSMVQILVHYTTVCIMSIISH